MIIVIDDMPEIAEWLTKVIQDAGYYADFALEAEAALYKMSKIYYSMAMVDMRLPGKLQGEDIAEHVKTFPEPFCLTPMVAMTGAGEVSRPELFVSILQKPFLPRQVREAIELYARPPIADLHAAREAGNGSLETEISRHQLLKKDT